MTHTYRVLKPLLDYIRHIKDELDKKDLKEGEIKDLKEKLRQQETNEAIIKELRSQINDLHSNIKFQQKILDNVITSPKPTENCHQFKKELDDNTVKLEVCNDELRKLNGSLIEKDKEIAILNIKVKNNVDNLKPTNLQLKKNENTKELSSENQNYYPSSCLSFIDSPGSHKIQVPGIDPFDVLCDTDGSIMMIQNIVDEENFNKDWAAYREGFGSFDGDFFLGLEKIHRLTNSRRYILRIQAELNNKFQYNQFDHFRVSNEANNYALSSLDDFVENNGHPPMLLRSFIDQQFSTFDRDNDKWTDGNCAHKYGIGWWHPSCGIG